MTLLEVKTDLKRLTEAVERVAVALERAFPAVEPPKALREEEKAALASFQVNDEAAWKREWEQRQADGEADQTWRGYAPRS